MRFKSRARRRNTTLIFIQDTVIERSFLTVIMLWLLMYIVVAVIFGGIYWLANVEGGVRDIWNGMYLSYITQATVGYGDISPKGIERLVAVVQSIVGTGFNGLALGLITYRLVRRPQPIRFSNTFAVIRDVNIDGTIDTYYWFRFVNVDTKPLSEVVAQFWFITSLPSLGQRGSAITYDTVGVEAPRFEGGMPPMCIIASKPKAEPGRAFSSYKNGEGIVPPTEFFYKNCKLNLSSRVNVSVTGIITATGEPFAANHTYKATDMKTVPFAGVNNDRILQRSYDFKARFVDRMLSKHLHSHSS